jgi:hypothetical protein
VGLVVMEACGSAHHWARRLIGRGIEVRLLPAHAPHHGARSVLLPPSMAVHACKTVDALRQWELGVQPRSNHNRAARALTDKLARICYATLRYGKPGRPDLV